MIMLLTMVMISGIESSSFVLWRCFKRRPRFVMSEDGRSLLNLWFLPHPLEVLSMFRQLNDEEARRALTHLLTIVGALHDILQFLFAHARLGTAWRYPSVGGNGMTADWGGTDAIGRSRSIGDDGKAFHLIF